MHVIFFRVRRRQQLCPARMLHTSPEAVVALTDAPALYRRNYDTRKTGGCSTQYSCLTASLSAAGVVGHDRLACIGKRLCSAMLSISTMSLQKFVYSKYQ